MGSLVFLLGAGVVLAAALVGGQVWVMTGSVDTGIVSTIVAGIGLGIGARSLNARILRAGRKKIYAVTEQLQDGEFVEIRDPLADSARTVLSARARDRPDRIAGTVRAAMTKNKQIRKR